MIIKELQEGNYIKYNNEVYKVTTLNTAQDAYGKIKTFITSKDNHTIDITEKDFAFQELAYIKITDNILNTNYQPHYSGGCFVNEGECPPEAKDIWELGNNLYITKETGYYNLTNEEQTFRKMVINIHELQNSYKEITNKELNVVL